MNPRASKQRVYASLMILGSGILLYLTLRMMVFDEAFNILVFWVILLLITEFLIDLSCVICSIRWWISDDTSKANPALRLGAAAALFHALRVLVYVLGRTGPWINFDVKPEHHAAYKFDWFWVYFAASLAILGVLGVVVIWLITRHKRMNHTGIETK